MSICNSAFPIDAEEYLSTSFEDKAIVSIANDVGFKVTHRDHKRIVLLHNDTESEYRVILFKDREYESNKCRIVIENFKDNKIYFYTRGSYEAMSQYCDEFATSNIESLNDKILEVRIFVYCFTILSEKQLEMLIHNFKNAKKSLVNRERRLEGVFDKYEANLEF